MSKYPPPQDQHQCLPCAEVRRPFVWQRVGNRNHAHVNVGRVVVVAVAVTPAKVAHVHGIVAYARAVVAFAWSAEPVVIAVWHAVVIGRAPVQATGTRPRPILAGGVVNRPRHGHQFASVTLTVAVPVAALRLAASLALQCVDDLLQVPVGCCFCLGDRAAAVGAPC